MLSFLIKKLIFQSRIAIEQAELGIKPEDLEFDIKIYKENDGFIVQCVPVSNNGYNPSLGERGFDLGYGIEEYINPIDF